MTRARDSGRARPHPNRVDHAGFQHGEAAVLWPGTGVCRAFRRGWRHQHDRDRRKPHRPGKAPALGLRAYRLAPSLSRRPHPKRR